MAKKPKMRMINSSRWQKQATVLITKELEQIADKVGKDAAEIIKDKLYETYIKNVEASYTPRSEAGMEVKQYNDYQKSREKKEGNKRRLSRKTSTYQHTGKFLESIEAKIEDTVSEKGKKYKYVKIKIKDEIHPSGKSTVQIYDWLTEGTDGGKKPYPYVRATKRNSTNPEDYSTGWARNYPTPVHLFEEHTRNEMKAFLDNFGANIKNDYKARKYKRKG